MNFIFVQINIIHNTNESFGAIISCVQIKYIIRKGLSELVIIMLKMEISKN
jgi:hypothetical protein